MEKAKKSPRSKDLGPNPPKEEGGGDNLGMSGYQAICRALVCLICWLADCVLAPFRHPITEVYKLFLCNARWMFFLPCEAGSVWCSLMNFTGTTPTVLSINPNQ